MGDQIYLT